MSSPQKHSWSSRVEHKFKFLNVSECTGHESIFNLKPKIGTSDTAVIACSDKYWAVPYVGGGGPVFISKIDAKGKVEPDNRGVNGHKAECYCVAFSPHDGSRMATAGDDGCVVLWDCDTSSTLGNVGSHRSGAREVVFHPTASGILASISTDGELIVWDSSSSVNKFETSLGVSSGSLDFNYDGSLLLSCCRDKTMRCVDPRSSTTAWECSPHDLPRSFRAKWVDDNLVVSCGPAKRGGREIVMIDTRKPDQLLKTRHVDSSNGALLPFYSEEAKVLWVFGRGDTTVRHYEIKDLTPGLEWRTSSEPHAGVAALPTRALDVDSLEIARFLRLSPSTVETVSYKVPRTEELKQYFNDDIYPVEGVRSAEPAIDAESWLEGNNAKPKLVSLRDQSNKPLLSERVVEEKTLNTEIVNKRLAEEHDQKQQDSETYARLTKLANVYEKYQPNNSMGARPGVDAVTIDGDEVADDEWDDDD